MTTSQLHFPKEGIKNTKSYSLPEDLLLDQWIIPAGTVVKMVTTRDFASLVLPQNCLDKRGFTIPKRFFNF